MVSPQNGCFILENPNHFFKGTIAKVFPKGARTVKPHTTKVTRMRQPLFKIVLSCGLVIPFSILAITGYLTPLNSSIFFGKVPFPALL